MKNEDLKKAFQVACDFVEETLPEDIFDLLLEEVDQTDSHWIITISFKRTLPNTVVSSLPGVFKNKLDTKFKRVYVNKSDFTVSKMKHVEFDSVI